MVSVFTPTYNRLYALSALYDSLISQSSYDFEWIIIDDGSTDDTEKTVRMWQTEERLVIHYRKVTNGGKHRAINLAVKMAKTEAFFIVDSDEELCPDAIEFINNKFPSVANDDSFAGISGLRAFKTTGKPIGGAPCFEDWIDCTNIERNHFGLQGDKAEVYKTSILKKYPFPEFDNEVFLAEGVIWDNIALMGFKLRWYNHVLYLSEYLADGLSVNIYNNKRLNPLGWFENIRVKKRAGRPDYLSEAYEYFEYFYAKNVGGNNQELRIIDEYERFLKVFEALVSTIERYRKKNIAIYGCGYNCKRILHVLEAIDICAAFYIDKSKNSGLKPVYSLSDENIQQADLIIITTGKITEQEICLVQSLTKAKEVFNYASYISNELSGLEI